MKSKKYKVKSKKNYRELSLINRKDKLDGYS